MTQDTIWTRFLMLNIKRIIKMKDYVTSDERLELEICAGIAGLNIFHKIAALSFLAYMAWNMLEAAFRGVI